MFTGIIQDVVRVNRIQKQGNRMVLHLVMPFEVNEGESIGVNGVCLTVEKVRGRVAVFSAVKETLSKTNLMNLRTGDRVNIESSLKVSDSLDGHLVYGHVDGMGKIVRMDDTSGNIIMEVEYPEGKEKYITKKGSVALDGISLTVVETGDSSFTVAVIPYTWDNTNLKYKKRGDSLNVEVDIIARYTERLREV